MAKAIYNPALASVDDISATSATFLIEPLHPGYGNTLGNSLRRVLLSSVRGGAVVAFRIEGATHEFTTVEGIKEDVVDIMLNLKNVHLRVFTDDPVELRIEKSGAGEVTAADIKTNADVEVVNPEQVIATIDDPNKHLVMDLVVEAGCGYQTIEESSEKRLHSDMIAIDAMYSPVYAFATKLTQLVLARRQTWTSWQSLSKLTAQSHLVRRLKKQQRSLSTNTQLWLATRW